MSPMYLKDKIPLGSFLFRSNHLNPHSSTLVLTVLCNQQPGQGWGMPFSTSKGQCGKSETSSLSCPPVLPMEDKVRSWLYSASSLVPLHCRAVLGSTERPQGQKQQVPGSSQTRKLSWKQPELVTPSPSALSLSLSLQWVTQ